MPEIQTWEDVLQMPEWSALNAEEQVMLRQTFVDNIAYPKLRAEGMTDAELQASREYDILNFDNGTGAVATFSKSLLKGITGMATSAVQGLGALTGIEPIEQAGKEAGAFMEREVVTNPSMPIANTLGGGVGSAAAFLGTMSAGGALGKALGAAGKTAAQVTATQVAAATTAGLTGGFLAGAGGGAQSADTLGMTGGDKYLRVLLGGATEVLLEKYLFGLGVELNALRGVRGLRRAIGTESVEEGFTQVGNNLADIGLAPEGANPPGVLDDVGMSMLGGAAGGTFMGALTYRKPVTSAKAAAAATGDAGAAAVLAEAENAATLLPVPMPELTPAPEGFLPEGALDAVSTDPADLFLPEDLPFAGEAEAGLTGEQEDPFAGGIDALGGDVEPGLLGEAELFALQDDSAGVPEDAQGGPPAPLPAAASDLPPVQLPEGLDVVQTGSGLWQVVDSSGAAVTPEFNAQDRDTALKFGARRVERQQAEAQPVQQPVPLTEKIKLTPAKEEPFTEPDLQIEAPELAQIIENGQIALPPPEYFAARRKRDRVGRNSPTLNVEERSLLRQWDAYEPIPAPTEVPRRARKTYNRLFGRTGYSADVVATNYATEEAVDPGKVEATAETLARIGDTLRRIGDETALTEEDYFAPQIEAEKQKQREMDAAFVQAVSQGNPVKAADLGRTLKSEDVIVLGDGTEAIVEGVEDDGTLNLWSETYGSQRVKPAESIGVRSVQQSPLNLFGRAAPEWAVSVARLLNPGSEIVMLGDNEFVEIDADPFSLGDKPAGDTPRKRRISVAGVRGARVRRNQAYAVVLNRDQITEDTPIHESWHGLIEQLPADIRSRGEALMTQHGRRYLGDIRRRYGRAGIEFSETELMGEALVTLLGNEGVAIWDKYVKSGRVRRLLMEWIAAVKTWFRDTFGYSPDITLEQWARMQNERFLAQRGKRQGGGTGMSFAGAKAETSQFMRDSLETARAMAAAGKSSEEIRALTGWFPGLYDGKMRWEIPDEGFAVNTGVISDLITGQAKGALLGDLVVHDSLFKAYPGLKDVAVVFADTGAASAQFSELASGVYAIRLSRRSWSPSAILHEIQHAIQEIEGFAQGSNPAMMSGVFLPDEAGREAKRTESREKERVASVLERARDMGVEADAALAYVGLSRADLSPREIELLDLPVEVVRSLADEATDEVRRMNATERSGTDRYMRTAGEIEARDVQARMNFTPEQRAAIAPYSSENIAPEAAIVFGVASVAQSRAAPLTDAPRTTLADGSTLVGPAVFSISAYHATPHKVDRFSLDRIGTGEGAQAYGWGLYFAESEAVSGRGGVYDQKFEAITGKPTNVYVVELLPDADEFMDWDKPLSEQSEKVKAALGIPLIDQDALKAARIAQAQFLDAIGDKEPTQADIDEGTRLDDAILELERPHDSAVSDFVRKYSQGFYDSRMGSLYEGIGASLVPGNDGATRTKKQPRAASEYLASLGIPGIRYLDGNSRYGGSGTYNYVIFDDKLVKILEENGKPVGQAAPPASAQFSLDAQGSTQKDGAPQGGLVKMWRAGKMTGKQGLTFFASSEDYASNYGEPSEFQVNPGRILDLTQWKADEDVSGNDFLKVLSAAGVNVDGLASFEGEPLQQISQRPRDPDGELARRVKAAGYDSIQINEYVYGGGEDTTIAVLDSSQFSPSESTPAPPSGAQFSLAPTGMTAPTGPAADPFYSQLERTITAKMPARADAAQILGIIRNPQNRVKEDEIKWSGIVPWLEAQKGPITKEAVQQYLAGDGAVRFEEVTLGGKPQRLVKDIPVSEWAREAMPEQYAQWENATDPEDKAFLTNLIRREHQWRAEAEAPAKMAGDPKHGQYVLPGGENYREVVVAMPLKNRLPQGHTLKELSNGGKPRWFLKNAEGRTVAAGDSIDAAIADYYEMFPSEASGYTSDHFTNVPNYLAHMRLTERRDASGAPGLFIEELQSDRHQAGRDKGYAGENFPSFEEWVKTKSNWGSMEDRLKSPGLKSEYNSLRRASGVPDAPYRKEWPLMLFKRALLQAVQSGKQWIGFTPGQVHTDRWGTERIEWAQQADGSFLVNAKQQHGGNAGGVDLEGEANARNLNKENSRVVSSKAGLIEAITPALTEGQDPEKLGEKLWNRMQSERSGVSMPRKEGFEGFYDNILPKEIGKYVKQWGGKVVVGEMTSPKPLKADSRGLWIVEGTDVRYTNYQKALEAQPQAASIWRVDITPAMQADVAQGLPKFSLAPTGMASGPAGMSVGDGTTAAARDAEYMAAVEAGDSGNDSLIQLLRSTPENGRKEAVDAWLQRNPEAAAKLQQRVGEAARAARYNVGPVYHTTKHNKNIEIFSKERAAHIGTHFGTEGQASSIANSISRRGGSVGSTYRVFIKQGRSLRVNDGGESVFPLELSFGEGSKYLDGWGFEVVKALGAAGKKRYAERVESIVKRYRYDSSPYSQEEASGEIRAELMKAGYDTVVYQNESESTGPSDPLTLKSDSGVEPKVVVPTTIPDGWAVNEAGGRWVVTDDSGRSIASNKDKDRAIYAGNVFKMEGSGIYSIPSDSIIALSPSQIKSADPVTYDAFGNVIPPSQRFDTASPDIRFSLAPTGMASGPAGTTRLRAVFEAEYPTENFADTEAQVRAEYEKLSKRKAPFDEFMSTLRDMNDNTENRWFNMSAPAFFGMMASDLDFITRDTTLPQATRTQALSNLRRLERYQASVAAAMGQHVKGYDLAWAMASPERQVSALARLHLFDGSAAKLKNHDEAVAGIARAAQEHAQAAAADIAPTDVAAQVERLVAADSAAAVSDEIIDTATEETRVEVAQMEAEESIEDIAERLDPETQAKAIEFFEILEELDEINDLERADGGAQFSFADGRAARKADLRAKLSKMTPGQRALRKTQLQERLTEITASMRSISTRAAASPDLIAKDPQALAVFKLQKTLELLINSGKKQPKSKTKSDAETVAAAIQAALLDKAGISAALRPAGADMATTIGLLIANQDSARQVLDQVQSQLNSNPATRGIISSGRLRAFGEAVIGRRFDTDDAAPYGPKQIAALLRDEMKAAKLDVRKLIRSAALTRMSFSVLEEQLRAPERGLESRIGPEALNRLVAAVRAEYEKTLAQRKAEADKKRTAPKRPTTKTAPATSPQAQQTLRAQMTESGAQQLLSALRSAMEQKPADGPLNAADKALNAELSRIIREAAAEATESKPTDPVDRLISQLGIPELRQERLDLLDQLVDEKIGTMEDPVQAAALRDAWITASEELRTRNVSKSTAARMVSRSIKGKDRTGLREAVRDGNELAITAIGERAVAQAVGAVRERVSQDPGMQATTTDAQIDALAADFTAAFGDIVEAARLRESEKARIEFRKEQIAQGLGVTLTAEEKTALLSQKPENLLDYVLKQFGFDYKTFASKFVTEAKGEAGFRAAVDQLAAQLGLDADQAELFARPLIERALKAMPEARAAALRKLLKAKIDKVAGKVIKKARRKGDIEQMVGAIELGALDEGTLDAVLQHITGVADISPQMKARMLAIVRRMQGDISPTQHAALRAELMHVIQGARGVPLGGLIGDTTMAHIFGGGNTMLKVNPIAGFVKFMADSPALFFSAVRGATGLTKLSGTQKRQAIAAMLGSTRPAFSREGLSMAERMFRAGIGPPQDDLSIYGESTSLETLHNSPAALIRLPGGKFLSPRATDAIRKITRLHPYVRRLMAATDLLYRAPTHQILKAQQAVLAVRDEASGGGRPLPKSAAEWRARIDEVNYGKPFPEALAEARATADAEVAAGTLDQKNYYQRTADLLDGMMADAYGLTSDYRPGMTGAERLAEIRERAKRVGFANRTTGVIGGVANVLKQFTAQFPLLRTQLPAINVPMNALNQALDWTPWGYLRSWIGTKSSRGVATRTPTMSVSRYFMESFSSVPSGWLSMHEVVNEETIAEMRFKAIAGTTMLGLIAMAFSQDFDKDEEEATLYITAQGPEDKAAKKVWMDRGFKPYHIYVNGTGFNFFETPLNSVLTSVGAWSDAHRYAPGEMDRADKAVFAMTRAAVATADASVLATLADLLGIIKGGSTASTVDGFKKISSRTFGSVVGPNVFREVNTFFYGKQDTKQHSWAGNALSTIPFIYSPLGFDSRPALNVFGEPMQAGSTTDKGMAAVLPMVSHRLWTNVLEDPQMHFVARHGINTYVTRRRKLDGTEIEDDYNTMRAWVQNSGKRLRAELTPEYMQSIDTLAETDKERAEELFDAFVKRIRDAELDALPGVAPRGN